MSRMLVLVINSSDYWKILSCGYRISKRAKGSVSTVSRLDLKWIKRSLFRKPKTLIKYRAKCHQYIMNRVIRFEYKYFVSIYCSSLPWFHNDWTNSSAESRASKYNWSCSGRGFTHAPNVSFIIFFLLISLND